MKLVTRLERLAVLRPPIALARRGWRVLFGWWCEWQSFRTLQGRARLVCESPDWQRLPRVPDAGRIRGFSQVMHNGLRVRLGSYYGYGCVPFFRRTRGVHEPQEELAFAMVLPLMPPGAVMLELGSYWAFYSMWFAREVPGARNYLVEPDPACLAVGQANFALNGIEGHFTRAFIGQSASAGPPGVPQLSVDRFCVDRRLDHIHLLHADIQGFELEMLEGARQMLSRDGIDFLFLSTHGEALHAACRTCLATETSLRLRLDVAPSASYSVDGLLVAALPHLSVPPLIVAHRSPPAAVRP